VRCGGEGEKLGSFSNISSEKFQKSFGKNIDGAAKRVLFRPSQDGAPAKAEDVTDQGRREFEFLQQFPKVSSKIFGKNIDEGKSKVFVRNLSLIGKLFEIYFVRLIGTPNQEIQKTGIGFGWCPC